MTPGFKRRRAAGWALALAAAAAGCAGPTTERFVPPPDAARRAVEAALRQWQQGEPPGRVGGTSPLVCVVDHHHRRPGQTLVGFTVLGEAPGEGPRCFAVRLVLDNPPEERKARYVVVGDDPLWVYRHEDYEMMMHWACREDPEASEPAKAGGEGKTAPSAHRGKGDRAPAPPK
jgi:hypothetical protein